MAGIAIEPYGQFRPADDAVRDFIRVAGDAGGSPVLYFQGAPGAPAETQLIAAAAARQGVALWAIDRARLAASVPAADPVARLAALVARVQAGRRLPMLGFSIGGAMALRVAARLGREAGPLSLLSAGGPLDLPEARAGMGAGAPMFRAAQADGRGFAFAAGLQARLARRWPALLLRLLFAGADEDDRQFAATAEGRTTLATILAAAWAEGGIGYRSDLLAYVAAWSGELPAIAAPVQLWHGKADRWAPIAMGRAMAARLADARLHEGPHGHYTTLVNQAPAALAAIAG